jgi:hypothetical protein
MVLSITGIIHCYKLAKMGEGRGGERRARENLVDS